MRVYALSVCVCVCSCPYVCVCLCICVCVCVCVCLCICVCVCVCCRVVVEPWLKIPAIGKVCKKDVNRHSPLGMLSLSQQTCTHKGTHPGNQTVLFISSAWTLEPTPGHL